MKVKYDDVTQNMSILSKKIRKAKKKNGVSIIVSTDLLGNNRRAKPTTNMKIEGKAI